MRWMFIFPLLFFGTLVFAKPSDEPTRIVKRIYAMLGKYDDKSPSAAHQKSQINEYWMFRDISLDAIQDQWDSMKSQERTRYLILMKKLLEKTIYEDTGDKIRKGYATIINQNNISDERAIVRSTVTVKKTNLKVNNDYGLKKEKNSWKIRDIYIDGQNLAEDYRSQYNKIAQEFGISGSKNSLLERIQSSLSKDSDWYNFSTDDDKSGNSAPKDNTPHKARPSLIH